jgi:NAD(P)-dependent dehydrogenase (short-subunit alcohol dehydrogenase family)
MTQPTIVITGGSGRIGAVLVRHFLDKGWGVVATANSQTSLDRMAVEYGKNQSIYPIRCDLRAPDGVAALVADIHQRGLQPYALVNNARNLNTLKIEPDGTVTRDRFVDEYIIDVVAPYELTSALARMRGGVLRKVVNIGSQYGVVTANPGLYENHAQQSPLHYSVAKAALVHLTRELAVRLAPDNIQVNCISFGGVEGRVDDSFKARYAALCPQGSMLKESDIPAHVDYLVSAKSSGLTGHNLIVDGGWTLW